MRPARSLPVVIIGSGPAGLMAAETLLEQGEAVELYEAMPALARKLLVAGQSGLNLTSTEPFTDFVGQYGEGREKLAPLLGAFGPEQLRTWVEELGIATFVGSTGRLFPVGMASGPLLDAWLARLARQGLLIHLQHRWCGWTDDGRLRFQTAAGERQITAAATIFALGGGSWPQLGSTGSWLELFMARGLATAPLRPANCGFDIAFSDHFRLRHQGKPVKNVRLTVSAADGRTFCRQGELLITATGVEGGLIYACSALLRDTLAQEGGVTLRLDLCPDLPLAKLVSRLERPRGSRSTASYLARTVGLKGVTAGLLYEYVPRADFANPGKLAAWIKDLPIAVVAPRPLAEAISSAGGLCFSELDDALMVQALPGTFCAGEMLDWEAPTGGYLLTACLATGKAAGLGASRWLQAQRA